MGANFSLSANASIVGQDGRPTPEFYRFLLELAKVTGAAGPGVLTSEGGTVAFRQNLDGVAIGQSSPAAVRTNDLRIDQEPMVSAASASFSIPVNINGTVMYLLLSETP